MSLLDRLVKSVGILTSWLTICLVLVIVIDVFFRYVFSLTTSASFELEWHFFALIFLLGAGWTLQEDRHVRVDVFYQRCSEKGKAWINLIGTCTLLLPFCIVTFVESLSFVRASFEVGETSPDPGGLPFRYLIKAAIPAGLLLLGLQGISEALKSVRKIVGHA